MTARLASAMTTAIRFGLAGMFIYAGGAKLSAPHAFTATIVTLQTVPFGWAEWLAAILPVAEVITGVWLATGWRISASALAALAMAATFAVAVAQAMLRGLSFDCHCFGVTTRSLPPAVVLARALGLFAAALWLRKHAGQAASRPGGASHGALPEVANDGAAVSIFSENRN